MLVEAARIIGIEDAGDEHESLGHHIDGGHELVTIVLTHDEYEGSLMRLHSLRECT